MTKYRGIFVRHNMTLAERLAFYSAPPNERGCILWTGNRNKKDYGFLKWRGADRGAHRLSWEVAHGPIEANLCVCHRCDTPACINPDHLFLGTHADNVADREAKGRRTPLRGEAHGMAKLTEAVVLEIRAAAGTQRSIAARFGIKQAQVSAIKRRRNWAHLP
jgi:hypothetical protein